TAGLDDALVRIKSYSRLRRKRLLLVEDDETERNAVAELLRHDDLEIAFAQNGASELSQLRTDPADCEVLDLKLPDMSGFDVLEEIRVDPALCDIPVVIFTGRGLSPDDDAKVRRIARSVVVKGVEAPGHLVE